MNSILLLRPIDMLINYPSPAYQILNVNWSAFLWGILPTHQNHHWNNDTNGQHQLGSGHLRLLPLPLWPANVAWAIVWASWLLRGVLTEVFYNISPHLTLPHHPANPLPL